MANSPYNLRDMKEFERPERKAITTKLRTQNLSLPWFPMVSQSEEKAVVCVTTYHSLIVHITSSTATCEVKAHIDFNTNLSIRERVHVLKERRVKKSGNHP